MYLTYFRNSYTHTHTHINTSHELKLIHCICAFTCTAGNATESRTPGYTERSEPCDLAVINRQPFLSAGDAQEHADQGPHERNVHPGPGGVVVPDPADVSAQSQRAHVPVSGGSRRVRVLDRPQPHCQRQVRTSPGSGFPQSFTFLFVMLWCRR